MPQATSTPSSDRGVAAGAGLRMEQPRILVTWGDPSHPTFRMGQRRLAVSMALLPSSGRAGQALSATQSPAPRSRGITIDRPFPSRILARTPWEPPPSTRSLAGKRDRFRGQHLDVLVREGDTERQIAFKYSTLDAQRGEFRYLALDLTSGAVATNIESS